jgi:hypothetical protein
MPSPGKVVPLRATRIHRDGQLMLELMPNSVKLAEIHPVNPPSAAITVSLGRHTFRGEIVDSKCWMGVMNPGVLTPHRACAVRCISGGIPPMLLVPRGGAPPLNLLLVSPDDKPDRVLSLVAEPVEITGEIVRSGELLTLRADPATYRRISRQNESSPGHVDVIHRGYAPLHSVLELVRHASGRAVGVRAPVCPLDWPSWSGDFSRRLCRRFNAHCFRFLTKRV